MPKLNLQFSASRFALFLLTAGVLAAADASITFNVIATNHHGEPVTDLQPGDLHIILETPAGKVPQPVTSLIASQGRSPLPVVVLSFEQRGVVVRSLKESLARLPFSVPAYLYILEESGKVLPVIPVTGAAVAIGNGGGAGVGPALDKALETVSQIHTTDMKVGSLRTEKVYGALGALNVELARLAGRKQLLWITYGIAANLHLESVGWVDVAPRLRELGARFNATNTAVYTVDPGLTLGTVTRDGLFILSGATGGRTFSTSDLNFVLSQMRQDGQNSYAMQFAPPATQSAKDGYHKVKVNCDRKDVKLVTQQVYLARTGK